MNKKNRKTVRFAGAVLAAIGLGLFGVVTAKLYTDKINTENSIKERYLTEAAGRDVIEESPLEEENSDNFWLLQTDDSGNIELQGKAYRRNTAVKAILLIGADTAGQMEKSPVIGSAGQADGIFLAAQDTARDKVKILMIPRDTMTNITLYDLSGNSLGKDRQHLTLAFAYGDGREKSCEMVEEGVSELLGGLKIDGYMAVNTSMIAALNDEIGGVRVTIPEEGMEARDEAMVKGKTMTLQGKQAEIFVRYRDIQKSQTAISRMDRQKLYMKEFLNTAKQKASKDNQLITRLVNNLEKNMITDMAKDQYMNMGLAVLNSSQSFGEEDFLMLPGKGVETELFDEYHPDMEAIKPMVLELFYKEVSSGR